MMVSEMFIKPRRIKIINKNDVQFFVEIYNGKKDLYQTVYNYEDIIDVNTVIVDKIFLDFDFDIDMKFLKDASMFSQI